MKKLFKSWTLIVTAMMFIFTTLPAVADVQIDSEVLEWSNPDIPIESDTQESIFDLPDLEMKVAPMDPKTRCDKFPRPGCPNYIPPDDELTPQKLKCQDAGTCIVEVVRRIFT